MIEKHTLGHEVKKFLSKHSNRKIVFTNGITLPVAIEYIENEGNYVKQNCETKAAYKLLERG